MNNETSKLVLGRVPANTVCPFKSRCTFHENGQCNINGGGQHSRNFSCAVARAYDLIDLNAAGRNSQ
jgi:hypothetical protein